MNRMLATVVFTALAATGCAPAPVTCVEGPTRNTLEGTNGSSGNNGLLVTKFQEKAPALRELMGAALFADKEQKSLAPGVVEFLDDADGRKVFDYAVRCALAKDDSLKHECSVYNGEGIITTTTQWKTAPLDEGAREDLFTCLVAHLNPLGITVPIFLSGPSVDEVKSSEVYPVKEALWTTTLTEVGVTYSVWPLFPWPEKCAADPLEALENRVCGHDAPQCFLDPHTETFKECIQKIPGNDGVIECDGKPAIMTRLKNADFLPLLYPDCFPMAM